MNKSEFIQTGYKEYPVGGLEENWAHLMTMKILEGDCLQTLKSLPDGSVQCVVTSPPYWGLRDYGIAGQLGMEPTPQEFVINLVAVFREVRRVLRDDGTLWLNLGDCYTPQSTHKASPGKRGGMNQMARDLKDTITLPSFGKPKDLVGLPWRVAFALQEDGWYLRSDIVWEKPNPMPESVEDRPTRSHEFIFLLAKSERYYYDFEAIKEPCVNGDPSSPRGSKGTKSPNSGSRWPGIGPTHAAIRNRGEEYKPMIAREYRNKRDVWRIATGSYNGAHFATFPPDLIEPCILAGSKPGDTVLDPFNGSGTTGEVSIKHHRNYIGCELNPKYIELTLRRLAQVQPVLPAMSALTPAPADGEWYCADCGIWNNMEDCEECGNVRRR